VPVVVATGAVSSTAFDAGAVDRMQAKLIAPITPSRKCRNCSLIGFPLFGNGRYHRPISGELLWCRLSIAGSLADNARMTAIQSARKQILYGKHHLETSSLPGFCLFVSRAAYSFL
jgi:hypothetical protein